MLIRNQEKKKQDRVNHCKPRLAREKPKQKNGGSKIYLLTTHPNGRPFTTEEVLQWRFAGSRWSASPVLHHKSYTLYIPKFGKHRHRASGMWVIERAGTPLTREEHSPPSNVNSEDLFQAHCSRSQLLASVYRQNEIEKNK